jgi:ketosteroid isomerase-like protein
MWESGDLARFDEIVATDYVGHVASGTRDRGGLRARIQAFHKLFPDIHFTIEDQFARGDKLVTRMRAQGTNSTSGTKTELMGINISRIRNGKLVEEWAVWEPLPAK